MAMRGWTALCPKVKLEGEQDTTGCRLIWAVADLVKHSVWDETTSCAALMEGGGSAALESRVGLKTINCGRMGGGRAPGETRGSGRCAHGARRLRDYSLWDLLGRCSHGRIPRWLGGALLWDDGRAFATKWNTVAAMRLLALPPLGGGVGARMDSRSRGGAKTIPCGTMGGSSEQNETQWPQ